MTRGRASVGTGMRCACGTTAAKCAPCAPCRTACGRAWRGCRSAGSRMRAARGASVNVLTPVEPTDWGGGSGLYDTFIEVEAAR